MKYIILLILAILSSNVKAQYVKNKRVNYEGSVELNSAVSLNETSLGMFGVETIHGILFVEDQVFIGLGVGVNIVHFTPYIEKMTGDIVPEMFHYDFQKRVCPTASFNLGFRTNNIRKLRKKMILFANLKFMHLWNIQNTTGFTVHFSETSSVDMPICDVGGLWREFSIGAEFKLRNLPNLYVGCGYLMTSGTSGEGFPEWTPSVNNNAEAEERKTYNGSYKIKKPATFFIKIGIHLWKGKGAS